MPAKKDGVASPHSQFSSLREKTVEHLFLGEVLRELWNSKKFTTEVSRSESDSFGYDLVIECKGVIRHIQLKSRLVKRPRRVSVAKSLAEKPSGCVIVVMLNEEIQLGPYLWYGDKPGRKLPSIADLRSSKSLRRDEDGNRPNRSNHVDIPPARFAKIATIRGLVDKLFG